MFVGLMTQWPGSHTMWRAARAPRRPLGFWLPVWRAPGPPVSAPSHGSPICTLMAIFYANAKLGVG
jgi:hypothetical protein